MSAGNRNVNPFGDRLKNACWYAAQGGRIWMAHYAGLVDGEISCSCHLGTACRTIGKHPIGKHWRVNSVIGASAVRLLFEGYPNYNYCLLPDESLLILDIDRKAERDGIAWLCAHLRITEDQLARLTCSQRSPSGGLHLIFRRRTHMAKAVVVDFLPGVDLPIQIIGAGSANAKGRYDLVNQIAPVPEPQWLTDLLVAHKTRLAEEFKTNAEARAKRNAERKTNPALWVKRASLLEMLRWLDPVCSYTRWRDIVFAGADAPLDPTEDDGSGNYEIMQAWSRGDYHPGSRPDYDDDSFDVLWQSNHPDRSDSVHFGTLVHLAKLAGYRGSLLAKFFEIEPPRNAPWLPEPSRDPSKNFARNAGLREMKARLRDNWRSERG